jgi:hypothetical protein
MLQCTPTSTSIPTPKVLMRATYGLHINAALLWAELFALLTTGAAVVNRSLHTTYVPLHYPGYSASDGSLQPLSSQRQRWRRRSVVEVLDGERSLASQSSHVFGAKIG